MSSSSLFSFQPNTKDCNDSIPDHQIGDVIEQYHHNIENTITKYLPLHTACCNGIILSSKNVCNIYDTLIHYDASALIYYDIYGYIPFHIMIQQLQNCSREILQLMLYQTNIELYKQQHVHHSVTTNLDVTSTIQQQQQWYHHCSMTLPCTQNGTPALFVACEYAIITTTGDDDDDDDEEEDQPEKEQDLLQAECHALDIILYLVEHSLELFIHRGRQQ